MWDPKSGIPWRPSKRQEEFIQIPDKVFEAMYGGAAGGGKSELLIMLPIIKQLYQYPQYHGITFRRTFPQLDESIIKRAVPIYSAIGGTYNEQKRVFTFPSGGQHRFSYLERDEHARAHDTAEYNLLIFDELTAFSDWQYKYMTSRVRTSSNLPAMVRAATNPGNIGHAWVRSRFVDPAPQGGKLIFDQLTNSYRSFIPAKIADNPYLMKDDPSYFERLRILPENERKAKMEGDWYLFEGQVFEEFRPFHVPGEPDHAVHVVDSFTIPSFWPRFLAVDWGYDAQTYAIWAALSPAGQVFVYREYSIKKASIKEWSADIARLSQGETLTSIVIDPSAKQNRGFDQTIHQMFVEFSGFDFVKLADNDRVGGKNLIHEYLRWRERPKRFVPPEGYSQDLADRIFRMNGTKAHYEYLQLFTPDKPETEPMPILQIFPSCKKLIEAIQICVYDDGRPEDVAEFKGDDPYDTVRYLCKSIQAYYTSEVEEMQKVNERAKLVASAKNANDLYMKMRYLESKKPTSGAVYH